MKYLREYRKAKGLTQRELGLLVGLPQTDISDFEKEKDSPNRHTQFRIALTLGVSFYDLARKPEA